MKKIGYSFVKKQAIWHYGAVKKWKHIMVLILIVSSVLTAKMQLIFVFAAVKNQMLGFAAFKKRAKETLPSYDKESKTLTAQNFELSYVACKDVTQFL